MDDEAFCFFDSFDEIAAIISHWMRLLCTSFSILL